MRSAPFPALTVVIRVFVKAAALFVILNAALLFTGIDPTVAVMRFNTWGVSGQPGTPRLSVPNVYLRGQMPLEALLAAHQIAYTPKASDEFRVIVLGDSAQWGAGLNVDETLSAQLTARNVRINGKRLVVYNLAYLGPNVPRDVLILDAATRYQPDLIVWFVTAVGFSSAYNATDTDFQTFFRLNRPHWEQLLTRFDQRAVGADLLLPPLSALDRLLPFHAQDALPVWIDLLLLPFMPDASVRTAAYPDAKRVIHRPIPAQVAYQGGDGTLGSADDPLWQFVRIGQTLSAQSGARLLVINEPMFISAQSGENANTLITRRSYDTYHSAISRFATAHSLWYADLWDLIPPQKFTDTVFHADGSAWSAVAERLAAIIQAGYATF